MDNHGKLTSVDEIETMYHLKTALPFSLAFAAPAIVRHHDYDGPEADIQYAKDLGKHLGIFYQISDDINDEAEDREQGKTTIVTKHGVGVARDRLTVHERGIITARRALSVKIPALDEMVEKIRSSIP